MAAHPADPAVVAVVRAHVPDVVAVYRYGSAGTPWERPDSDLDIAVLAARPLPPAMVALLRTEAALATGRHVDLHDLRALPVTVRVRVVLDGVRIHVTDLATAEAYATHTLSDYVRLNEERRGLLDDIRVRESIYG